MFNVKTYKSRRDKLKKSLKKGLALFPGNEECPMNYPANTYHFRQDSNFLYYFGLDEPSLMALIDIENDREMIFGNDVTMEDIIWMGPQPSLRDKAGQVGINDVRPGSQLIEMVSSAVKQGRKAHILPPYRGRQSLILSSLLVCPPELVKSFISEDFIKAVIAQRSIKTKEEIEQIEEAHKITAVMQITAMKKAAAGMIEADLAGELEGIALKGSAGVSFPIILSVHGEILHNHSHDNIMKNGDLLVLDCGAESRLHYAADITRTFPVSGKFSAKQKTIYNIVLNAQLAAINAMKPGVNYKDIHLLAAKEITEGLKVAGLLKGNTDDIVNNGTHALFFPHGLGHMMGLDVHDMEGLGEDYIGYNDKVKRSDQFGLAYLRMGKALAPGMVITVEPGIYFIPALIHKWRTENRFMDFINYDKLEDYMDFGGIRIEDDVLVTESGHRVIGGKIPKTIAEVEKTCQEK
ncbi:MAG: aminopeptidase P family protein [Calditrichaceae bacterium]|nr:aminopeptidase P family protein [Calditrichaceae bacterium]MBN2707913.1 aminopeptidase P family protein [Calditrichaceae bacterium]RQV92323.1 MAG: aminopeptidase P family protein [Calditrichota bacterium]